MPSGVVNHTEVEVPPYAGRSLHVVHVVLTLDVGGLERNVVNQVREGRKLGQRVTIVCLERTGALAERARALGGEVVALGKRPGLRPGMVWRMAKLFRRLRPDVVHSHQLATLLYGGAAARLLRVPVVIHTEHGREGYDSRLQTRLLGRVAGSFCDAFYCLTADMASEVRAAAVVAGRKVRVIQNGIDMAAFTEPSFDADAARRSLAIPPGVPLVGTVGRLTEVKRQDVLIRAFAAVRREFPKAHLVLVGDGPSLSDLRALADQLGVGAAVHFAGYQQHAGPWLKAMDVFALTSRSEGMPQAVLEASVMGLPVVASRVGGLPEVIVDGSTGILFPAGDGAALAAALCELLGDRTRRQKMGAAARARVECRFHVKRMAAEYHRDFLDFLGPRAGRAAATADTTALAPAAERLGLGKGR